MLGEKWFFQMKWFVFDGMGGTSVTQNAIDKPWSMKGVILQFSSSPPTYRLLFLHYYLSLQRQITKHGSGSDAKHIANKGYPGLGWSGFSSSSGGKKPRKLSIDRVIENKQH